MGLATGTDNSTETTPPTTQIEPRHMMGGDFGRGSRGCGRGGFGEVEVSSEYKQKINDILNSDSDVKALLTQGYNVTGIRPNIAASVSGDGTVTQKAKTASVTLVDGETGFARVLVDVSAAKVTRIEITTRTVIDKSTS